MLCALYVAVAASGFMLVDNVTFIPLHASALSRDQSLYLLYMLRPFVIPSCSFVPSLPPLLYCCDEGSDVTPINTLTLATIEGNHLSTNVLWNTVIDF